MVGVFNAVESTEFVTIFGLILTVYNFDPEEMIDEFISKFVICPQ
jgi:hypothetical protein